MATITGYSNNGSGTTVTQYSDGSADYLISGGGIFSFIHYGPTVADTAGITAISPAAVPASTGTNPIETSYSLYGHIVPVSVFGVGRIGGEIIAGPWVHDGLADFIISFGVPADPSGTRDIREIAFDSEVVWTTSGTTGVTTSAGGTFLVEAFTWRFYQGTLTQAADTLETTHFGAQANAYRPQILLAFSNLPLAGTKFGKIPYVAAVIGDGTGNDVNFGEAFERLAYSPWVGWTSAQFETSGLTDGVTDGGLIIAQETQFLQLIQQFGRFYPKWDILQTDKLRIRDRGSDTAFDIQLTKASLTDALTFGRAEPNSVPKKLELSTIDPDADYTIVPSTAQTPLAPVAVSTSVKTDSAYLPVIMDASTRMSIVTYTKYHEEITRKKVNFTAMAAGLEIEPGDFVAITGLGDDFQDEVFRVVETLHGANYTVEATAESILNCNITPVSCVESGHAAAFLARTSGLDVTHVNAYTALLNGLETDGLACSLDFLYVYATQDRTTGLLNLIQNRFNGVEHGSPTFTADQGFSGTDASTTKYIATGFNPTRRASTSLMQKNSGHLSLWSLTNASSDFPAFGAADTVLDSHYYIYPEFSDGNAYFRINANSAGGPLAPNGTPLGHYIVSRNGFTNGTYRNGVLYSNQFETSQPIVNLEFYAAAYNLNGTPAGSGLKVAAISGGTYLDATQSANLYARLRTYMTAVGVP